MRSSDSSSDPLRLEMPSSSMRRDRRITRGGFAIWLDPFGMLEPQIVVNLVPELGVGVDLVRPRHLAW